MQQLFPPSAERFIDRLLIDGFPCISVITEIELLCWKTATERDVDIIHNFVSDAIVIELERSIKLKTADIRKAHKAKLPDAIIAATAIIYNCTLVTRNTKDFKSIPGFNCN
ncbi:MAG: type II toxin-antitoxin system VapC family toxin [Bacteroidia bacterium]|nr:type II toxin-antitoxin system VapC family toxin [Bacteroidia bacterium]